MEACESERNVYQTYRKQKFHNRANNTNVHHFIRNLQYAIYAYTVMKGIEFLYNTAFGSITYVQVSVC